MNVKMFRPLVAALVAVFAFLIFIGVAWASDGSSGNISPMADLLYMVLQAVISVVGVFALWAAKKLVGVVDAKTEIEIKDKVDGLLDKWAKKGVSIAEERSHNLLKEKGHKLPSTDKLNIAIEYVIDKVRENKLDERARDKIIDYVDSALGETRPKDGDKVSA